MHHRDRGSQYVSTRYTERPAEAGIEPSVGSRGDSYDNALAEAINGLYKTELIHRRGPWQSRESVELATLEWVAQPSAVDGTPGPYPSRGSRDKLPATIRREARDCRLNLNQPVSTKCGAIH